MTRRGNGEGSIFQRASDDRWVGSITLSKPGQPRRRKSIVRERRADVVTALRELQGRVDRGVVSPGRNVTVRAYLEGWLGGLEGSDLAPRTRIRYGVLLRNHALPLVGHVPLVELQPGDVRAMLAALGKKPGRSGKPLAAQTILHCRAALRTALSDSVGDGLLGRNPAAGSSVSPPKAQSHEVEAITPEQANAIVAAVREDPLGGLFRLLLWSGLRLGEASGLRWSDVDVDPEIDDANRWIRVRQTYGVVGGSGRFDKPKTEKSRRDVPLIADGLAALREQKGRQTDAGVTAGPGSLGYGLVFTEPDGSPIDPRRVSKRLHTLLAPIGLPMFRPHDLRHAYATLLIRKGVPIPTVAKLLGHSSPIMVLKTYGHVASDSLQEAAARLNELRAVS